MIENLTYHILHKEQNGTATLELNPNQIEPEEAHQNFLDTLTRAYRGRAGKRFGEFDSNEDNFPLPRFLRDYLTDNNFQRLTERMMNNLLTKIQNQTLATGGKVFIAHYQEQNKDYLLVAILSDSVGFSAQNWEISENEILDIDHLKYAGRIDLTAWQANETRYISFLKGQREVSAYFKEFLSCNDDFSARNETTKLVGLLEEFATEQQYDIEQKTTFFNDVKSYLTDISNNGELFSIETFANHFSPDNPQLLVEKLSNLETGVQDSFTPDKTALKKLTTFVGKTTHWRLSFDRNAINNGDISQDNGKIIIHNPTPELLEAFQQ